MSSLRQQEKRAIRKPSLVVKLSLPTPNMGQALQSPSTSSGKAPDITVEKSYQARPGSSSQSTRKRTAIDVDKANESGIFTPPSGREQGSKRQRLQPPASNPEVNSKTKKTKKTNVKPMHDDRPEPRGLPEVWAEVPNTMDRCKLPAQC